MKDKFVNDWGDDFEGQSGFLIKNNIEMQGIFAPNQEQHLEQTQGVKR